MNLIVKNESLLEMISDDILDIDFLNGSEKTSIEIVNINKFILLSLFSLGIYEIWWMYKSWRFFKEREVLDIIPAARALFAIYLYFPAIRKNSVIC